MATMIPHVISDDTESSGEKRIFELMEKELPDHWIVIHSLKLVAKPSRSGETDFTVISPLGIFCLEVKTGEVTVREDQWFSGSKSRDTTRNPFDQAREAASKVFEFLNDQDTKPIRGHIKGATCLTGYGVLFPDVARPRMASMEIDPTLIYDMRDKQAGLQKYIERIADHWHLNHKKIGTHVKREPYDRVEIEKIANALRPNFTLRVPLTSELGSTEHKLISLTQNQFDVIQQFDFDLNPRMMVEGCAGSGKTLCAIELAKSQARTGKKVLITCFNKKLPTYIRRLYLNENDGTPVQNITVQNFHSLMHEIMSQSGVQYKAEPDSLNDKDRYFREELPGQCADYLKDSGNKDYLFDTVIVDEGQDLLNPYYILVLEELVRGGLKEGQWILFLDSNQSIFDRPSDDVLTYISSLNTARHRLMVNCRNTQPVAELSQALSGIQTGIVKREGPKTEQIWWRDGADEARQISRLVNRWLSEDIKPSEITILSHRKMENSSLAGGFTENVAYKLYPWDNLSDGELPADNLIRYSTIQSYKGLESKMVIIAGINYLVNPDRPKMPEILSCAATRSTGITVASMSEILKDEFESRVSDLQQSDIKDEKDSPKLPDTSQRPADDPQQSSREIDNPVQKSENGIIPFIRSLLKRLGI